MAFHRQPSAIRQRHCRRVSLDHLDFLPWRRGSPALSQIRASPRLPGKVLCIGPRIALPEVCCKSVHTVGRCRVAPRGPRGYSAQGSTAWRHPTENRVTLPRLNTGFTLPIKVSPLGGSGSS